MSDSFADLWNSSAPVKPSQPTPKLGTNPAPSLGAPRPKYDAFAMLAASGSNSSSRPHSRTSSTSATAAQKSNGSAAPTTSGDAFSDLLSGSFGNNPSNAKLSMAERARAKTQVAPPQPITAPPHSTSTWAGLDSLAVGTSFSSAPPSRPAPSQVEDDWPFGSSTSSAQAEFASPPKPQLDDWGLPDFVSHTKPSNEVQPEHSSQGRSLWDPDDFNSPYEQEQGASSSAHNSPPSRSNSPGDFDFGDRENALLDDNSESDDDILGDLGRPVHKRSTRRPPPSVCDIFQKNANFLTTLLFRPSRRHAARLPHHLILLARLSRWDSLRTRLGRLSLPRSQVLTFKLR
jgi:hypothetical protein